MAKNVHRYQSCQADGVIGSSPDPASPNNRHHHLGKLGLVSNLFCYIPQHSRRVRMGGPQRWKSCASFPAWIFGHGCGPGDSDVMNST